MSLDGESRRKDRNGRVSHMYCSRWARALLSSEVALLPDKVPPGLHHGLIQAPCHTGYTQSLAEQLAKRVHATRLLPHFLGLCPVASPFKPQPWIVAGCQQRRCKHSMRGLRGVTPLQPWRPSTLSPFPPAFDKVRGPRGRGPGRRGGWTGSSHVEAFLPDPSFPVSLRPSTPLFALYVSPAYNHPDPPFPSPSSSPPPSPSPPSLPQRPPSLPASSPSPPLPFLAPALARHIQYKAPRPKRDAHRPLRSVLFTPGSRPDKMRKALTQVPADVLAFDLEDSVSYDR